MPFVSIGKINTNLIPILVGCVFCFLNRLLNQYEGTLLFDNSILTNIFISISKLFTIIPLVIVRIRSHRIKSEDVSRKSGNQIEYIYTETDLDIKQSKLKYIVLSSVIVFIQSIFFVLTFKVKSNCWILDIFITTLFYYLFFKIRLYKHHYFSGGLIILMGFIIDLILGNLQDDISKQFLLLIFRLIREILYSFHDVIDKYIIEKKFGSIYEIALFTGIINLILLGIFAVLDYNYFGMNDYENYFNNFNTEELLVIFGVMITQLGLYLCLLMTNKNYTPCHIFIVFVFGQLAYYKNFKIPNSIIVIIFLILILFLSLMFNEIIEINFWGLSNNTKRKIIARAEIEYSDVEKCDTLVDNYDSEKNENMIELKEEENDK